MYGRSPKILGRSVLGVEEFSGKKYPNVNLYSILCVYLNKDSLSLELIAWQRIFYLV